MSEIDRVGKIPAVRDRAGVGDGSVHDAVVALSGALTCSEHENTALRAQLAEAQKDAGRSDRRAEVLVMERNQASARSEMLIKRLTSIYALMHPEPIEHDGKKLTFTPPDNLVREAWEGLSKAIRDIPAAIDAAKEK